MRVTLMGALALSMSALLIAARPGPSLGDDRAPPDCKDGPTLDRIKSHYHSDSGDARRLREIKNVTQISYGPSPFDKARKQIINSRFCRATGLLDNGETDTLYWRLDWIDEGKTHSIQRLDCTLRHDVFKDKCKLWRPKEFPPR